MLALSEGGGGREMAKEFESKLHLQNHPDSNSSSVLKSKSFVFRAPQEQFSIQEFQLGKIYGVGSYSKVVREKKRDTGIVYALKNMNKQFRFVHSDNTAKEGYVF